MVIISSWALTLLPKPPGNCIRIKVFHKIIIGIFIPKLGKETETAWMRCILLLVVDLSDNALPPLIGFGK